MTTNDDENQMDDARWQAQERARRLDADADPAELIIARALRRAPPVDFPVEFAATVPPAARALRALAASHQSLREQRLLRGLVIAFALSAAVVVAWFGRGWVAELAAVLPGGGDAVAWSGVAALCLLGNWAVGLLRGQHMRGSHAGA